MKAINDTVVIKVLKNSHETESGLELYSSNNGIRYNYGEVITASEHTVLKEGDRVYYDSVSGSKFLHNGEKLLVLRERDIAIIDD